MESAGEARPGIWIATTECRGEESSVSTSTTPHTLSCTNLDLALVTTREEGSTLCSVSIIGKRYIGRTVLVMSDMKARLTSRLHQLHRAHSGSSGGLVTRGITRSVELCNKSQAE